MKKINVVGLGYIGLPTAIMFASNGVQVVGVDIFEDIVNIINAGKVHIEEPGIEERVKIVVESGMLRASLTPEKADAFIISVPTPNKDDEYKSCDLKYVINAVKSIIPYLEKGNTVIVESTIAPRSTEDYILPLIEEAGFKVGKDIYLAHCPERVLPGQIFYELVNNNRIVGGVTKKCSDKAAELYSAFVKGEIIKTEAKTAEMSKLMENTYRDVNIALANELTKVCNSLDINVLDVIAMANKHPRVNILSPGPGVGGHCLAIDPYFICAKAPEEAKIIKLSRDTNKGMPSFVANNVDRLLKKDKKKTIAIFGITYKPNVDDVRESPSLEIVNILREMGYVVKVHDPHAKKEGLVSRQEALKNADMLLCLVSHDVFKDINDKSFDNSSKNIIIFDVVNVISKTKNKKVINYGNLWEF